MVVFSLRTASFSLPRFPVSDFEAYLASSHICQLRWYNVSLNLDFSFLWFYSIYIHQTLSCERTGATRAQG
jgi:hypothetical protein